VEELIEGNFEEALPTGREIARPFVDRHDRIIFAFIPGDVLRLRDLPQREEGLGGASAWMLQLFLTRETDRSGAHVGRDLYRFTHADGFVGLSTDSFDRPTHGTRIMDLPHGQAFHSSDDHHRHTCTQPVAGRKEVSSPCTSSQPTDPTDWLGQKGPQPSPST